MVAEYLVSPAKPGRKEPASMDLVNPLLLTITAALLCYREPNVPK